MSTPVAIEVRHLHKSFERPGPSPPLRDKIRRPLRRAPGRPLRVLEDISFDVRQGEVFGVVGPNGSGKSTLLKLLASIYRVDRGSIRIAGRLAPLIELGVGFRPDLPARDNVVLNGVMMGLTPDEARRRFDQIIAFAGLEEFTDLKLRNYSSGMKGRLGFSVMTHVDADVLLVDEILSVGDQNFRDKCADVFVRMRAEGRTIVLVSHEMGSINKYCDRAMILHDRKTERIGEPEDVANRYLELNALRRLRDVNGSAGGDRALEDLAARIVSLRVEGELAGSTPTLNPGEPLELEAVVELAPDAARTEVRFVIQDSSGRPVFVTNPQELRGADESGAGTERLRVRATVENRFAAGRYMLLARVVERDPAGGEEPAPPRWLTFAVAGDPSVGGLFSLDHEVVVEPAAEPEVTAR